MRGHWRELFSTIIVYPVEPKATYNCLSFNMCHINPAAWVALVGGYALVKVMRRVLGEPICSWWDGGVLSFIIVVAFSYLADPKALHWNSTINPLGSLIVNYLYSFVVVC